MPGYFQYDIGRTEFYTVPVHDVRDDELALCQEVTREAMTATMGKRRQTEIDAYVQWKDLPAYIETRRDPQVLVERGVFNSNQDITHPHITFAVKGTDIMGFAYAADNVSGDGAIQRRLKRITPQHNYLYIREMAVRSAYQRQGVGLMVGYVTLQRVNHHRPVSIYVLDELYQQHRQTLGRLGFEERGDPTEQYVFGGDTQPTQLHSMWAHHAGRVLLRIERIAGAQDAIFAAAANIA